MFSLFRKILFSFSKSERYIFWLALAFVVSSFFVLAGIIIGRSTKTVPASGGEYTEGIIGQPTYINPVLASSETDKSLVRLLFSNLYGMADKIEMSENGRVWDVRLKEKLHWTDGQKLTSDDVIFTIQEIQDPSSNSPLFFDWQGVVPNRISELEIQFNLTTPYVFFADNLKELYVLPKHLFSETPVSNWYLSKYNLQPVGSGPYQFNSYKIRPDGFITDYRLKANNQYSEQAPLIQNLQLSFYSNKEDLAKAFNDGEIDGATDLETSDLGNIKRPYQTLSFHLPSYYAVFFNQSQNLPLQDRKAREALSLAIDRNELVKNVFQDNAEVVTGPVLANFLAPDFNVSSTAFSPDLANNLLNQDGWTMTSSSIREKKIKNSQINLAIDLTVPQIDFLVKTAEQIQQDWQKIGVQTTLNILPADQVTNEVIKNRNYQALLFGNILNVDSDLFSFWHSSERFYPGLNLALYSNKEADSLIESIRQTTSTSDQMEQFTKLQETITNDYPAAFLYSPDYLYIAAKNLQGLNTGLIADPADIFSNVNQWYIKTARVLK